VGPRLDAAVLAMGEWPEAPGPGPAVRLSGGLFRLRTRVADVLDQARGWRPFGPSAGLAPTAVVADEVTRWECALHGVGLVTDNVTSGPATGTGHVPAEAGRRAPARHPTADRWIEETLYALALDAAAFGP